MDKKNWGETYKTIKEQDAFTVKKDHIKRTVAQEYKRIDPRL